MLKSFSKCKDHQAPPKGTVGHAAKVLEEELFLQVGREGLGGREGGREGGGGVRVEEGSVS